MRTTILLALLLTARLSAQTPALIPIAAARQQAQGSTVTVMGLVTVRPGDFSSSSGDEGFAIQDQTGGIWVSVEGRLPLRVGQRVRVQGALGVSNGKLQIVPVMPGGVEGLPGEQLRVATGQVGAATLGFIVTIEGAIVRSESDDQYGWKIWIDDGSGEAQVYLNKGTRIDPRAPYLQIGKRIRVTGFGNIYDTTYEVDPRSRRDIVPLR